MSTAHYQLGDTRDLTAKLPDHCIDLVLTSPPFLALRSYLPDGHPDKHREIGSEPTPAEFIDTLLALTADWGRVLTPGGSIAVELGDSYSGGSSSGTMPAKSGAGWPNAKSLALIPELYRIGLAYGRNPLTGDPSPAGQWLVRNVVRWHRPNPPVGALGDKYRPATSDMVIATRAKDRWFDLDAVRHPHREGGNRRFSADGTAYIAANTGSRNDDGQGFTNDGNPAGAPPLDTWIIPTHPYKGAHYATFPTALCERPIKSMCPLERCRTCGHTRARIVHVIGRSGVDFLGKDNDRATGLRGSRTPMPDITRETLGWTDCGCAEPDYRPGVVLDPFAGSGTTLQVAAGHGRHALGFDIDERNIELARDRIGGLFLTDGPEHPDWLT